MFVFDATFGGGLTTLFLAVASVLKPAPVA